MTDTIPSYLRIHRGPDSVDPSPTDPGRDPMEKFWLCYANATQWRVDLRSAHEDEPLELLPVVSDSLEQPPEVAVSKSNAERLARSAIELATELQSSHATLRRQEAELAAQAAIVGGAVDQQSLADRLEQTLADVATACSCTSAAMYLLDDDTEYLKARSVYGLPVQRLAQPARLLRGSRGDLEAMVQGVVTINDLSETSIDTWNCPESVASAICAVINADDVPIGTLWLFNDKISEFGAAQIAATRMAASQLSLHLQIASAQPTPADRDQAQVIQEVADWQCDSLPIGSALAKDWLVDGMIESPRSWATGWHTWDVLPDGSLMLAIGEAVDSSARGAMSATIARAAMTSHLGYRHSPSQLLQRVNDTLWQTSTCEQLISMLYVRVDPETGEGDFAAAGKISAMIGSRYGYRPLVDGRTQPLCSDFRASFVSDSFRMMPGETMLAFGPGMSASGASQNLLGDCIRSAMQDGSRSPLAAIRRTLAGFPLASERGAATLIRLSQ